MNEAIHGKMTFLHVIKNYPGAAQVLAKHRLGCLGCMGAANETIEQGAVAHGLDVKVLLDDLNQLVSK